MAPRSRSRWPCWKMARRSITASMSASGGVKRRIGERGEAVNVLVVPWFQRRSTKENFPDSVPAEQARHPRPNARDRKQAISENGRGTALVAYELSVWNL